MYLKCCVPGCGSLRQDAILHKFPMCEKRLQKWLDCINCDSLRNKSSKELEKLQVCHKHFEARFVTATSRLLSDAFPTLFLPSEMTSGIPLEPTRHSDMVHPIIEHNYTKRKHIDHNYCTYTVAQESQSLHPLRPKDVSQLAAVPGTSKIVDESQVQQSESQLLHREATTSEKRKRNEIVKTIPKIEALTPKCRKLYNEYRKSRKLLSFTRRAKKALHFSKVHSFEEMAEGMNPLAKKLLLMQIKLCTKAEKARRFTLDEKLIALSILKQGPKSYRFLQKIFILPSSSTLKKLVSKLHVDPGINAHMFESIKEEVNTWKEEKKYCTIVFDEMALDANFKYTYKDQICGFVELTQRTNQIADHVLVFMIKGIVHKWQQPIAYYFCEGSTPGLILKPILTDIVTAIGETGLIPLALVSDQGASFQSALKKLQEETRRSQILQNENTDDTIQINGFKISVIYDPCHLIKGLRNNFLTKNISFNNKISQWKDIVDVYQTDCQHTESRLLHKLNDEHVMPEKIKKMKVKNCVRVFSKTMAGALNFNSAFSHYSDGSPVSKTLKNTAEVVSFFDDLFDSVNGSTIFNRRRKGKLLRSAVTRTSKHHAFWQDAITKLQNLKFVDQNDRVATVPSVKNWITTLKSIQRLWQVLNGKNIKIMRPRYLNSDAIENFFGQVRAYNFRDNNPTCHNFISTYKSLLITGFIKFHHSSFNCENDISEQLLKIKSLFNSSVGRRMRDDDHIIINKSCTIDTYPVLQEARRERLTIQSRAYTAGWVVRKILINNEKCNDCKKDLTVEKSTEVHQWITHREYNKMSQKKLTYPAEPIVRYFGMIIEETNKYLEKKSHEKNLSQKIIALIENRTTFDQISCQKHREKVIHALLTIVIKLSINNWCNIINKILKGTDVVRLERNSNLPEMQLKALNKYKKKIKRKLK